MSATDDDSVFGGEHRAPEEIRRDIRETTAELTETLGAIQSKLAPEAIVAEAKGEVVDRALSLLNRARTHPAALAVVGVGAVALIARTIGGGRGVSTLLTFALGAVVGAATYRLLAGDPLADDDELDTKLTQEINPALVPPTPVARE